MMAIYAEYADPVGNQAGGSLHKTVFFQKDRHNASGIPPRRVCIRWCCMISSKTQVTGGLEEMGAAEVFSKSSLRPSVIR